MRGRQREHARPDPEKRQPEPLPHRDGQMCRILWKAKVNYSLEGQYELFLKGLSKLF